MLLLYKTSIQYNKDNLSNQMEYILDIVKLPKQFIRAKVIALLISGNNGYDVTDYCPISLLSVTYKNLERMILVSI